VQRLDQLYLILSNLVKIKVWLNG